MEKMYLAQTLKTAAKWKKKQNLKQIRNLLFVLNLDLLLFLPEAQQPAPLFLLKNQILRKEFWKKYKHTGYMDISLLWLESLLLAKKYF